MLRILIAAATLIMLALPASAQKLSLTEISRYLNGIQSAQGKITQINSDGTLSTGTLYIKRPGKMRFDYDPPEQALVVVGAGAVNILDRKLGGVPDVYPLNQTPLSIILARNVDLSRAGMVRAHDYDGTSTIVTAQDPERPQYGNIQLKFTGNPVELRQWVVTDGDGQQTTVVVGALDRANLSNALFNIQAEVEKLRR